MADSTSTSKGVEAERVLTIMAKHPELVCFAIALICTCLTNLTQRVIEQQQNDSLKQTKPPVYQAQPPPKRFFRAKSLVLDFPYGNLNNVGSLLEDEEVLFVMYYAPWCSESMRLRTEYERAALYLKNEVTFVAINCWYAKGQCRQKNDFHEFPAFYLYFPYHDGFRFSGVPSAENLVKFVQTLSYPLTYLSTDEELVMFLSQKDNSVIGYFDFNNGPQPPGFQQFYFASMRTFESEPYNGPSFAVISRGELASTFGMQASRTVFYCRALNDTLEYPSSRNFTMTAITKWVLSLKTESTVRWLLPSGVKSLQLSTELDKGPALIAFVPDAPLLPINQYYSMMREVVMTYLNCKDDNKWAEMIQSSQYARWSLLVNHFNSIQQCLTYQTKDPQGDHSSEKPRMPHKQCCLTLTFGNTSDLGSCDACVNYEPDSVSAGKACNVLSPQHVLPTLTLDKLRHISAFVSQNGCSAMQPTYNPKEFVTFCCDSKSKLYDSFTDNRYIRNRGYLPQTPYPYSQDTHLESGPVIRDPFIVKNTDTKLLLENRCRKLKIQRESKWLPPIDITDFAFNTDELHGNISQLGCYTNRTLHFYAMKKKESGAFLRHMGAAEDAGSNPEDEHKSSVVIVDIKNEFLYKMKEQFSKQNLAYLIRNYTENSLERHLRTSEVQPRAPCAHSEQSPVCIHEVTTDTFNDVVMDPNMDVVLLYYAPWCGFCAGFTHVYLSLAKYFKSTSNITFARINADKNDLPWHLTVDVYPTIVLYPAHRKSESEVFPDHLQKNLHHLVLFILKFATHSVKLETSLEICTKSCITANLNSSVTRLHTINIEITHIQQKIRDIESKLRNLDHIESKLDAQDRDSANQPSALLRGKISGLDKRDLFHRQLELYKLLLSRRYVQERSTRNLYNVLRTNNGYSLERHKIVSILKQFSLHEAQFKKVLEKYNSIL